MKKKLVDWKITAPGESTAFCPDCQVELGLTEVVVTEANPVYGEHDYICPVCHHIFKL